MASSDAHPLPRKGVAHRVTFPILDADGDLVANAAGLDSEISKNGGTFVNCVNEATQIASSSGMYFLDLTATEMNADTVAIKVKTSTAGAKTTPLVLYPMSDNDIRVNVSQWRSAQVPVMVGGRIDVSVGAMAASVLTAAAIAADAITAAKIAANAIGSSEFAQAAADKIWASAARTLTALGFNLANTDFAAGAIDAAAIAADAIGSAELAQAAVDKIVNSLWDELTAEARTAGSYGQLIQDRIDVAVSSRAAPSDLMGLVPASIESNTFVAGAIDANALAPDAAQEIADEILKRAISNVEPGAAFRTLYGAIASLVNRARINPAGNLEVYETDDATVLETLTATTDEEQDPITELDPP